MLLYSSIPSLVFLPRVTRPRGLFVLRLSKVGLRDGPRALRFLGDGRLIWTCFCQSVDSIMGRVTYRAVLSGKRTKYAPRCPEVSIGVITNFRWLNTFRRGNHVSKNPAVLPLVPHSLSLWRSRVKNSHSRPLYTFELGGISGSLTQ